jgi:DNA-binding NarL/FixJ family response regulator
MFACYNEAGFKGLDISTKGGMEVMRRHAMIKVLLADDHEVVREGTRRFIDRTPGLQVVGEAANGLDALEMAGLLRPDIVVLDIRMPGLNGLEVTRRIKAELPEIRVLILSAYEDDQYIFPLLDAGADGYLLKTSSGSEVATAIQTICRGEKVLDPQITTKVVGRLTKPQATYQSDEMIEPLTAREMEVLRTVAGGKSNKEVAEALFLSVYTVQVHLRNIYGKMGVANRTEAVTHALAQGWIDLEGGDV